MRFQLKEGTQQAHERLDKALIRYDLTTLPGLRAYLSVHFLARIHIQKILTGYENLRDDKEKLFSLRADFEGLNVRPPSWREAPEIGNYHPLGLIYVMAGSSLGSNLLFKQWSKAMDINVLSVNNFMTSAKDNQLWRNFLVHISNTSFSEAETKSIVAAANHCFSVFEAADKQVSEEF